MKKNFILVFLEEFPEYKSKQFTMANLAKTHRLQKILVEKLLNMTDRNI